MTFFLHLFLHVGKRGPEVRGKNEVYVEERTGDFERNS